MSRAEGVKNAKTIQWELMGEYLTDAGIKRYKELMENANAEDFPKLFMQVVEFFKPKLARKELTGELTIKTKEEIKKEVEEIFL